MVRIILGIILLSVALIGLNVVPAMPGLIGMLIAVMVAVAFGDRLDRSRQRGVHEPAGHIDRNRPSFHGESKTWTIPTPYIDHPDGGGTPPGVDTPPRR